MYHYTPIASTSGILREDNIHLWATYYKNLNDPLEFKWAKRHIFEKIKNSSATEKIPTIFPYVISFCQEADDLTMWRLFADNGRGILLEFDDGIIRKAANQSSNAERYQKCFYAEKDNLSEVIQQVLDEYKSIYATESNDDLQKLCAFIKHKSYEVEKEIRYCSFNFTNEQFNKPSTWDKSNKENIENERGVMYRLRGNELVKYKEILFKKEALKSITVGYGLDYGKTKEHIEKILEANGYELKNINIKKSKIQALIDEVNNN